MSDNAFDIVKSFYGAMNSEGLESAFQVLSDDFMQVGGMPEPRSKKAFRAQLGVFFAAMPDMKASLSDIEVAENLVTLSLTFNGTHTNPLDLSPMGLPVIPPSNNPVTLPARRLEYTVVDGKITLLRSISAGHEPGMADIFRAFGVTPPQN